jgi:hypothetical protein
VDGLRCPEEEVAAAVPLEPVEVEEGFAELPEVPDFEEVPVFGLDVVPFIINVYLNILLLSSHLIFNH